MRKPVPHLGYRGGGGPARKARIFLRPAGEAAGPYPDPGGAASFRRRFGQPPSLVRVGHDPETVKLDSMSIKWACSRDIDSKKTAPMGASGRFYAVLCSIGAVAAGHTGHTGPGQHQAGQHQAGQHRVGRHRVGRHQPGLLIGQRRVPGYHLDLGQVRGLRRPAGHVGDAGRWASGVSGSS
jgi:hypothetical protein